jgi:hypothetical protein
MGFSKFITSLNATLTWAGDAGLLLLPDSCVDTSLSNVGIVFDTIANSINNTHLADLRKIVTAGWYLDTIGLTMSFNNYRLKDLADPQAGQDAVTVSYLQQFSFDNNHILRRNSSTQIGVSSNTYNYNFSQYNSLFGYQTGYSLDGSHYNCFFGERSIIGAVNATYNIIIGYSNFKDFNFTGSDNVILSTVVNFAATFNKVIIIGKQTSIASTLTNVLAIGSDMTISASNTCNLGNSAQILNMNTYLNNFNGPIAINSAIVLTPSGTYTGTINVKQIFNGSDYRAVVIQLNGWAGTAVITYPVAYTIIPGIAGLPPGWTPANITSTITALTITTVSSTTGHMQVYGF